MLGKMGSAQGGDASPRKKGRGYHRRGGIYKPGVHLKAHGRVQAVDLWLFKGKQHLCRLHQHDLLVLGEIVLVGDIQPEGVMLVHVLMQTIFLAVVLATGSAHKRRRRLVAITIVRPVNTILFDQPTPLVQPRISA